MNSAALLLMLVVRIYADNVEGPTGKKKHDKRERKWAVWFWMVSSKPARFCVVVDNAVVVCALLFYDSNVAFKVESGLATCIKSCSCLNERLNHNRTDAFTAVNFLPWCVLSARPAAEAVRHGRPPRDETLQSSK